MDVEKYLPIGTVVLLKGGKKKLMITGYGTVKNKKEIYDYVGHPYPEGIRMKEENYIFNHNQIERIYHFGYRSQESIKYNEKFKKFIEKMTEIITKLNNEKNN